LLHERHLRYHCGMNFRSSVLRALRLLALLIQIALPALAAVADARLEIDALTDETHIESQSHDCDSRHHPEDCALCQFLRSPVLAGASSGGHPLAASPTAISARASSPARTLQRTLPLPRGPPRLS
jgi:hypothetical protein